MGSLTSIVPATNTTCTPAVNIPLDASFASEKHLAHHLGVHTISLTVKERKTGTYNNSSKLPLKNSLNPLLEFLLKFIIV